MNTITEPHSSNHPLIESLSRKIADFASSPEEARQIVLILARINWNFMFQGNQGEQ